MPLDIAALETAIRGWVVTAVNDATVAVIFAQGSAPRPGSPFVTIYLTAIEQPEWDDPGDLATDAITAVDTVARTFTVAGNRLLRYPAGQFVVVGGSNANDARYPIELEALMGGSTVVTVTTAIPDATADGVLTGVREIAGHREMLVQVDCLGTGSLQRAEAVRAALSRVTVLDALADAGLAVYTAEPIRDLTGLLDTERGEV